MRMHAKLVATAVVLAAAGLLTPAAAVAAPTGPARPTPPSTLDSVPGADVPGRALPKDPIPELTAPLPATWPTAGTAEVTLAAPTTKAAVTWAAGIPVGAATVHSGNESRSNTASTTLRLQLLDHAAAAKAGRDIVVRATRTDGAAAAPTTVAINYAGFADAYGGDWAGRLSLVALPDCALTTPAAAACQPTALASSNDRRAHTLSATAAVPAGGVLLAVVAGPDSDNGDYKATELKASSTWTAGGSSGDFAWQYPLRVPPGLNGPAPKVALGYSAESVDGQTAAVNAQPSWIGEGFNWQPGSIVRSYRGCADDGKAGSGDLCWAGDNAVLTLNGTSTELVLDPTNGWRPKDEDGSKIEKLAGAVNGDNDGEYWKVTGADGTQYFFGLNRLPGWRSGTTDPETNSTFYAPVFGNNANEPCQAQGWCQQAYQWNLDYVLDPHGNSMSLFYQREMNNYGRDHAAGNATPYVRSGHLTEIDYGTRQDAGADSVFAGTAAAKVVFEPANRCVVAGPTCTLTQANAGNWPDVPTDQVCAAAPCTNQFAPTFFSSSRLASVTTFVATGAKAWRRVERWKLTQAFKDPGDNLQKILWLSEIGHCGTTDDSCVPATTFIPTPMANRVDVTGTPNSIVRYRMRQITTDSGGSISITYSAPECVAKTNVPASPDTNTKRCFPTYWIPPGATAPKLEYFHKYRVEQVAAADLTGGGPDQMTNYFYGGTPAWHFTDSSMSIPARRTWDQWRGYQSVRTVTGAADSTQSEVDTTYFRGMDGDRTATGTRTATVPDSDGGSWPDSDWFAGMARETVTLNGPGGAVLSRTKSDPYASGPTATQSINGVTLTAYVTDTAVTTTKTALDGGRGWRTTRSTNTFLADRTGRVSQVDDEGDTATTADDRCTRTTYAADAAGVIHTLVSRVETVAVRCAATPDRTKDVISDVRTWYDGATAWSTAVTRGDVTRVENLDGYPGGVARYAQMSRASYDPNGRVLFSYDELDHETGTVYTPASGAPVTRTTVTDPRKFATTTDLDPAWAVATATTDQNGSRTDLTYDGLGRLTGVWLPGRDKAAGATPDQKFAYTTHNSGGPNVVASSRLDTAGTGYVTGYTIYDGWLRARQSQVPAPGGGRLVSETLYDSRGLPSKDRSAYFNENAPAGTLFAPTGDIVVPLQTVDAYDGAGRQTAAVTQVDAVEKWRTSTVYGGDHTDVTAPAGGTGTSTWTDGRDQVTAVWQYHGSAATGAHDVTSRTYTPAGDLATVTDADGSTWSASYDQRRRRTEVRDPNRGKTTYDSYDGAGNPLSVTDARGVIRTYAYDVLGRQTEERRDSAAGPLLASYSYDSLPGGKGQPAASTSYDSAGNGYVVAVAGYTARYQPTGTTTTVPPVAGALAGTYTTKVTYNADASIATSTEPAKSGTPNFGGLPDETLRYGYDSLGMVTSMSGAGSYVTDTQYLQTGQLAAITQTDGVKSVIQSFGYEHGTARLVEHQVIADIPTVVAADTHYSYQPAGNITSISDTLARYGAGADDTQCFGYDYLGRVTDAWTPTSNNCAAAPSTGALGGAAPYWNTYSLDATGDRTGTVERTPAGTSTSTYAYPTGAKPHAVSSVATAGAGAGTSTFGYDPAGNTTTRAVTGRPGQTLSWNADNQLAGVTDSTGRTDYTYAATGNRLLAKDPAGTTLYVGDTECRATGPAVSCTRLYDYTDAGTVGVRTPAGLTWQATDHQGTPDYSFRASDMAFAQRRTTPFGTERGSAPTWPSSAGFVNGVRDTSGLTHLGARDYDPALGRFASVDPVFDVSDPQSWHGYAYADSSPVSSSDPTGLRTEEQYYGPGGKDKDTGTVGGGHGSGGGGGNVPPSSGGSGAGGWAGSCDGHHSAGNCDDNGKAKKSPPPKPKDILNKTTYGHGTVLTVYYDGTVTINGHRVPAGTQDPGALAAALDNSLQEGGGDGPRKPKWLGDIPWKLPKPLAEKIFNTHWMIGVCPFSGSAVTGVAGINGSACLVVDAHGPALLASGGGSYTKATGAGDFAGAGVIYSDGNIDDQGGWFDQIDGGVGDGEVSISGSYAWGNSPVDGRPVHTSTVVVGPGAGASLAVGKSYTAYHRIPGLHW